jgi:enterochelin esterase family protein
LNPPSRTFLLAVIALLLLSACTAAGTGSQQTRAAVTQMASTPTAQPTAANPVCTDTTGTTTQMQIESAVLDEPLTFSVYLPPCYSAFHEGGYPIIYLFHGQTMNDTTWPELGITDAADSAIQAGSIPFIMVFPYEIHNWDFVFESKFGDAFISDLVPYVESHYAVCLQRSCQAIGGLSRGGGWAMHIGLTHLEKFGAIGAHSMGYFSGDMYRVENLLQTHTLADFPRIYLDRGAEDYLRDSIDQYEQNLTYTGVVHEYVISPGKHEKAYWQSQVQNYLAWYIKGFSAEPLPLSIH